jgi:hypothetical protein
MKITKEYTLLALLEKEMVQKKFREAESNI